MLLGVSRVLHADCIEHKLSNFHTFLFRTSTITDKVEIAV
jgi:hypothetical protein